VTALAATTPVVMQRMPSQPRWSVPLVSRPIAPPLLVDDRIYVALESGLVMAYRAADGGEAWRRELRADGPLAAGGARLFVAAGEAIYALNADGSPAWHADTGALTAPMLVHDGWLVVSAKDQLTAYRATDGTIVWRLELGGVQERPSIDGTTLFLSNEDGRVLALDLATGKQKWERRLDGAPTEVLAIADRVFVGSADKHLYCLDADNGTISWRQRIGAALRGRPAADAERVYAVALDNSLRAFDRGNGALRWSPRGIPFRPTAGPVVIGDMVAVAGTTKEISAFDAATGRPAEQLVLAATSQPGGEPATAETLATSPAYRVSGPGVTIVAITGSLNQQWTLRLAVSNGVPVVSLAPLTELPGLRLPIPPPPAR